MSILLAIPQHTFLIAGCLLLIPQSAHANIGLPMLVIMWPLFFLLFLPIVYIEAHILKRYLPAFSSRQCWKASFLANMLSTLVGIPLTWLVLAVIEMLIPDAGAGFPSLSESWQNFLGVTAGAAWLVPSDSETYWMIPTACITLLIPFFFVSAWTESMVTRHIFKNYNPSLVDKATWSANLASYALPFVLAFGWTLVNIFSTMPRHLDLIS